MSEKFDDDALIRMKESKFHEFVELASKTFGLKRKPRVTFVDGYIDGEVGTLACIDVYSWMIFVSRTHLKKMSIHDIKETAMHEVTHLLNASHDTDFRNKLADLQTATWQPENTVGIRMIRGDEETYETEKIGKSSKPKKDKENCNYHLCRKKTKLKKCSHCDRYFCEEHIKPIPPKMPNFDYPNKNYEWRNTNFTHPCPNYYDYLVKEEKERHRKYGEALDSMSGKRRTKYREIPKTPIEEPTQGKDWLSDEEDKIIQTKEPEPEKELETAKDEDNQSSEKHQAKESTPKGESKPIPKPKSNYFIKLKKWFFRKNHPYSRLRINDFALHLSVVIGLSFLFWLTYTNSESLNSIELWILRLGAIIQIILFIFIIRSVYKLIINLKYGIRGLVNGYKVIGSIIAFLFCAYFISNANVMVSSVTDFNYGTFNPIEINWNVSNTLSNYDDNYDTNINDDYNGNQDITIQPEININELETEIHVLVNNERQTYGLSPLEYDTRLADIARAHSQDMATRNYFSHDNPEGQDPTERAEAAGYPCYKDYGGYYTDGIAENIFQNWLYTTITYYNGLAVYDWSTKSEIASSTVSGWMLSEGHRQNILKSTYDKEGIGIAISSDYKVYITQDFW